MIVLHKKEKLHVYQMLLTLQRKKKEHPAVAILMRAAEERGKLSPRHLRETLLDPLSLRACENLLQRLTEQGYFENHRKRGEGGEPVFTLTKAGWEAAKKKSYWEGERGDYKVYISTSPLLKDRAGQEIILVEKLDREREAPKEEQDVPRQMDEYRGKELIILEEGQEERIQITECEKRCYRMENKECLLRMQVEGKQARLTIEEEGKQGPQTSENDRKNRMLGQFFFELHEEVLRDELLKWQFGERYDSERKVVRSPFDEKDLSLRRTVSIQRPIFEGVEFEPVTLEGVPFVPLDMTHAERWMEEWLFRYIDRYFWNDEELNTYLREKLKPIFDYYPDLPCPTRAELVKKFSERENAFYKITRLETANYLTY